MEDVTHPAYPFKDVRASLLFIVEEWAMVHTDISSYQQRVMPNMGAYSSSLQEKYGPLKHARIGSTLEILGVFDGSDDNDYPLANPNLNTAMVWARHYFEKGWIPAIFLLPMVIPSMEIIQARILQASQVPEAVRLAALLFSPRVGGTLPGTAQTTLKEWAPRKQLSVWRNPDGSRKDEDNLRAPEGWSAGADSSAPRAAPLLDPEALQAPEGWSAGADWSDPTVPPAPEGWYASGDDCSAGNGEWETDSLGNYLFDPDEPDPEYFC